MAYTAQEIDAEIARRTVPTGFSPAEIDAEIARREKPAPQMANNWYDQALAGTTGSDKLGTASVANSSEIALRGLADLPMGATQAVLEHFPDSPNANAVRESIANVAGQTDQMAAAEPGGSITRAIPQMAQMIGAPAAAPEGLLARSAVGGLTGDIGGRIQPTAETDIAKSQAQRGDAAAVGRYTGMVAFPLLGALGDVLAKRAAKAPLTKAEQFLLDQSNPQDIAEAQAHMDQMAGLGVDSNLVNSLDNPEIRAQANVLARTGSTSNAAQKNMRGLEKGLDNAEGAIVGQVAPDTATAFEGAAKFKEGLATIDKSIREPRAAAAKPLYEAAHAEVLPADVAKDINKSDTVQDALRQAQSKFKDDFNAFPNGSVGQYDLASQELKGRASALRQSGDAQQAQYLEKVAKGLDEKLLSASPSLKAARAKYTEDSEPLNEIFGNAFKGESNFMQKILDQSPDEAMKSLGTIFSKEPTQIAGVKAIFGRYGQQEAFEAAAKAHVINKLDSIKSGAIKDVLKTGKEQNRLRAALGDQRYQAFSDIINAADNFQKTKNALGGSPTEPLQRAAEKLDEASLTSTAGKVAKGLKYYGTAKDVITNPERAIANMAGNFQDRAFIQELSDTLFNPDRGRYFVEKIAKAEAGKPRRQAIAQMLNEVSTRAANGVGYAAGMNAATNNTKQENPQ